MKLSTDLERFKRLHKKKINQTIHFSLRCNNYKFIENLYKFILVKKNSFIFESVEKGKVRGRYTIIGFNPDKNINIKINKTIEDNFNRKKLIKQNILNYLNKLLKNFKVKSPKELPRMSSMLVGYFSYDIIRLIEKIPNSCSDDINIPDIRLMRPKNLIIYDNFKSKIFFIENIFEDQKIEDYQTEYNKIGNNLKELSHYGNIPLPTNFYRPSKKINIK